MAYEPTPMSAMQKAARFLALALEARERGNYGLAEMLTEAAGSIMENAAELEATLPPPRKNLSSRWPNASDQHAKKEDD